MVDLNIPDNIGRTTLWLIFGAVAVIAVVYSAAAVSAGVLIIGAAVVLLAVYYCGVRVDKRLRGDA